MEPRHPLYQAALDADNALQAALEARYGNRAGDMRYRYDLPAEFRPLQDTKLEADRAWLKVQHA